MPISESEKNALNNMCPVASQSELGTELEAIESSIDSIESITDDVASNGLYTISGAITADGTGGIAVSIPFDCTVVDAVVLCTTGNAAGSVTISDGTNAITDAIACVTIDTIGRAGTIDSTYSGLSKGDALTFTANGAADRGVIEVIVKKA